MTRNRVGLFCMVVVGLALASCGPSGATPDASGEITIIQIDEAGGMRFEPEDIVLTAGQTVRIVLENQGEKDHEFMVGREVQYTADGAPNGFVEDFFEGIEDQVTVLLGEGAMLMIDNEMIETDMGDMDHDMDEDMDHSMEEDMEHDMDAMEHDDEHDEGHHGWMVMDAAGSEPSVIEFVVPLDRVGEWEMGCFEDDGTHYEDGMKGTITVVEP